MCLNIFNQRADSYLWLTTTLEKYSKLSNNQKIEEIKSNPSLTKMFEVIEDNRRVRQLEELLIGNDNISRLHKLDMLVGYWWFESMIEQVTIKHQTLTDNVYPNEMTDEKKIYNHLLLLSSGKIGVDDIRDKLSHMHISQQGLIDLSTYTPLFTTTVCSQTVVDELDYLAYTLLNANAKLA